jgi:hypothetical protein
MTYKGERARPMVSENGRFFEVSKIRLGADGHVRDVLWGEVDAGSDRNVGVRVLASAAEVVDAMHDGAQVAAVFSTKDRRSEHRAAYRPERAFVIVLHEDGRECITFDEASSPGRNLIDIDHLDG